MKMFELISFHCLRRLEIMKLIIYKQIYYGLVNDVPPRCWTIFFQLDLPSAVKPVQSEPPCDQLVQH